MLKQQVMTASQKYAQLPLWKRMTLVTAILFSGSSLATFVSSQAAYASSNKPNTYNHTGHKGQSTRTESTKLLIVCKTGNGGKGGSASRKSNGLLQLHACNTGILPPTTLERQYSRITESQSFTFGTSLT